MHFPGLLVELSSILPVRKHIKAIRAIPMAVSRN
jgi:hypothetical protein